MNQLFKLSILPTVLTITIGIWLASNNGYAIGQDWQPLAKAPRELVQQLQKDVQQGRPSPDITKSEFLRVKQKGQVTPLYLIDTSSTIRSQQRPSLCGRIGCLFAGYLQQNQGRKQYRQVTSGYLNQFLPAGTNKVEITNNLQNGLPCLKFNQLRPSRFDHELISTTYCFDGYTYQEKKE